jgi:hypothetical protein
MLLAWKKLVSYKIKIVKRVIVRRKNKGKGNSTDMGSERRRELRGGPSNKYVDIICRHEQGKHSLYVEYDLIYKSIYRPSRQ